MDPSPYLSFAASLSSKRDAAPDVVLDPDTGLIKDFMQECQTRYEEEGESDTAEWWMGELELWLLVQMLYAERTAEQPQMGEETPWMSPYARVQRGLALDPSLRELNAIRNWLTSLPSHRFTPCEVRKGYWPYTKNALKQKARMDPSILSKVSLDPDMVFRGGRLETEDEMYEKALLKTVWEYIRVGDLDLAADLCREAGQAWRAASLEGGRIYHDPALSPGADAMDVDVNTVTEPIGNERRGLWKRVCRTMSSNSMLDIYERAAYGALTGDLPSVLPLCTTWHDALWAHVNSLLETKVDTFLPPNQKWEEDEMKVRWEGSTKKGIAKACEEVKAYESGNVWYLLQRAVITGREGEMIGKMAERIQALGDDLRIHILRFLTHFILFLKGVDVPLPPKESNEIIRMYVEAIEKEFKDQNLLAYYASFLEAEDANESYAHFLKSFDLKTTLEQRREALFKAHAHGLDIAKVAERVHELLLRGMDLEVPSLYRVHLDGDWASLHQSQLEMLRGLEWLQFDSKTFSQALIESNKLALFFLAGGQIRAVCEVQDRLPEDFLQFTSQAAARLGQLEEADLLIQIGLYDDLRSICDVIKWIREFNVHLASGKDVDRLMTLVEMLYEEIVPMLEKDWLLPKFSSTDTTEGSQLALISLVRRLYIPELVLTLHSVLYSARGFVPTALSRTMTLANTVADPKYKVFKEFVTPEENRMTEYLLAIREAALASAEVGKGDPFRVAAFDVTGSS